MSDDDDDDSKFITRDGRRIAIGTVPSKVNQKNRKAKIIGCPPEWLSRVIPVVKTKEQVAVALWVYRRYKICKAEWFPVSNKLLRTELGISRKVKYTTLRWLERAGAIALRSRGRGNKRALEVKMLW